MKYGFFDIQPESAHPEIIKYLLEHNLDHFVSPEEDKYADLGVDRIKKAFGLKDADVYYMPNGTASNVVGLSSMLKPFEGVICPDSGHINNYEAGALEATGHKIITVNSPDGKLNPRLIETALDTYEDHNNVLPKAIYLTQVTEKGTIYTKNELEEIITYAKSKDLYTYVDGARLAMAIASEASEITIEEFGSLDLDMFYVGGTKNGGIYGEALVIKNDKFKPDFPSHRKRQGADMGKQRPISLQFARFFDEDNLWLKLAAHANKMGAYLREGLEDAGVETVPNVEANHAFVVMRNEDIEELENDYGISRWGKIDDKTTRIRLVCGWSTKPEDMDEFLNSIRKLSRN